MRSKNLSICFFTPSAGRSGSELALLELNKELMADYEATCTIVTPRKGPLVSEYRKVGANVRIIPYYWWCGVSNLSQTEMKRRLVISHKWLMQNLSEIRKINPDIIVTNTLVIPWGAVAASCLGKPHVWYVHEFGEADHNLKFFVPFSEAIEIIKQSSNLILTCSNAVKNILFGKDVDTQVETVYYHIDLEDEQKDNIPAMFLLPEALKLIITGSIRVTKGQVDAILAVNELVHRGHNVELLIIGDGELKYVKRIRALIKNNCLDQYIKIMPFATNPFSTVNQADIVLLCSKFEAFGRVTLEAFLLQKPVIATNTGATVELITDGYNGLLYEPNNYLQLAGSIEYFIKHPEKIGEMGENAYLFAKNKFTKENYGGKTYHLLENNMGCANRSSEAMRQFITRIADESTYSKRRYEIYSFLSTPNTRRAEFFVLYMIGKSIIEHEGIIEFIKRFVQYIKLKIAKVGD